MNVMSLPLRASLLTLLALFGPATVSSGQNVPACKPDGRLRQDKPVAEWTNLDKAEALLDIFSRDGAGIGLMLYFPRGTTLQQKESLSALADKATKYLTDKGARAKAVSVFPPEDCDNFRNFGLAIVVDETSVFWAAPQYVDDDLLDRALAAQRDIVQSVRSGSGPGSRYSLLRRHKHEYVRKAAQQTGRVLTIGDKMTMNEILAKDVENYSTRANGVGVLIEVGEEWRNDARKDASPEAYKEAIEAGFKRRSIPALVAIGPGNVLRRDSFQFFLNGTKFKTVHPSELNRSVMDEIAEAYKRLRE